MPPRKKNKQPATRKQPARGKQAENKHNSNSSPTPDVEAGAEETPKLTFPPQSTRVKKATARSAFVDLTQDDDTSIKATASLLPVLAKPRLDYFPFMELPIEIRVMIYGYFCNYNSIEEVTAKLAALPPNPNMFDEYDDDWSSRTYALMGYNVRKKERFSRFRLHTPGILLVNKEIHAEAIHELRMAPLVVNDNMSEMFERHRLTIAHFMPLPSLQMVEHVHFTMHDCAKDFKLVMYDGGKITKDMNKGKIRMEAYWKGILLGAGEKVSKEPAIRKVTFKKLCSRSMMLDLSTEQERDNLEGYLCGANGHYGEEFDRDSLECFVVVNGSPC